MAELTQEQVEQAAEVAHRNHSPSNGDYALTSGHHKICLRRALIAAAPFLQLPWADPTQEEARKAFWIFDNSRSPGGIPARFGQALLEFVNYRNAVLLPKPVDPRIAIIRHQLGGASMVHDLDGVAAKILHALDSAK